ncbi:hypothetical protein [Methanosphaera sp.]|uniref:hypothetical protein n=1 Tax=Methanosphaera sp. TaxID=2666342 RepID=UPI002E767A5B|nr:hypothetical protein [Methanosphaera sp.]MEE1116898.1 hypothetical protein [Methanosphaera sp.]
MNKKLILFFLSFMIVFLVMSGVSANETSDNSDFISQDMKINEYKSLESNSMDKESNQILESKDVADTDITTNKDIKKIDTEDTKTVKESSSTTTQSIFVTINSQVSPTNVTVWKNSGITDVYVQVNHINTNVYNMNNLKNVITLTKSSGIKVHAWVYCFVEKNTYKVTDTRATLVKNQVKTLINNYNIAGVCLDGVRYSGIKISEVNEKKITNFVKDIHTIVKNKNSNLLVSVCVLPEKENTKKYYGQNYAALSPYTDVMLVLSFKYDYKSNDVWMKSAVSYVKNEAKSSNVVGVIQTFKTVSGKNVKLTASELTNDVNAIISAGSNGYSLYKYGFISSYPTNKNYDPYENKIVSLFVLINSEVTEKEVYDWQKCGITDVYVQVNYRVSAIYNTTNLDRVIALTQGTGIKVHALIICFVEGHVVKVTDKKAETIKNEVKKLIYNHNIAGICLDYVRYSGLNLSETNSSKITNFVRDIHTILKTKDTKLQVSACVFAERANTKRYYGQDYAALSPYVDVMLTLSYKYNYRSDDEWMKKVVKYVIDEAKYSKVVGVLQTYKLVNNKAIKLTKNELNSDVKVILYSGADGYSLYRYKLISGYPDNITQIKSKFKVNVKVENVSYHLGTNATLKAQITDWGGNPVSDAKVAVKINYKTFGYTYVKNGIATFNQFLSPDIFGGYNYKIQFVYGTNDKYETNRGSGVMTVTPFQPVFTFNPLTVSKNNSTISVKVKISNDTMFSHMARSGNIGIKINGNTFKIDSKPIIFKPVNGMVEFIVPNNWFKIGFNNLTITYSGNSQFEEGRTTITNAIRIV